MSDNVPERENFIHEPESRDYSEYLRSHWPSTKENVKSIQVFINGTTSTPKELSYAWRCVLRGEQCVELQHAWFNNDLNKTPHVLQFSEHYRNLAFTIRGKHRLIMKGKDTHESKTTSFKQATMKTEKLKNLINEYHALSDDIISFGTTVKYLTKIYYVFHPSTKIWQAGSVNKKPCRNFENLWYSYGYSV